MIIQSDVPLTCSTSLQFALWALWPTCGGGTVSQLGVHIVVGARPGEGITVEVPVLGISLYSVGVQVDLDISNTE